MADEQPDGADAASDDADAAAAQTSGTQGADGRNAEQDSNIAKLNLEWKLKAEHANALERENAILRARQSPAAEQPQDTRPPLAQGVKAWADKGDEVAQYVLESERRAAEREQILVAEIANKMALDQIADQSKREKVAAMLQTNRHRLGDVKAALDAVEADELRAQSAKDKAENERLQSALRVAQQPNGSAPPTHHRGVPAYEMKGRTVSEDEYYEARKGLTSLDLLKLEEQVDRGEIKVKR